MAKIFLQNFDGARADLLYSYKLDSLNGLTPYMIGSFYYEKGDLDSAILWLGKAISINPRDPDFRSNRSAAYLDKNEPDKALADINIAISVSPGNTRFLYLRGYIKQHQTDLEGALADYNAVLKIDSSMENNYFSYIGISYCHFNLGEPDRGLSEVTDVLKRYPKVAYALLIRGKMYKGLGDKEKACADAMALKSIDPGMAKEYFESYCN
jgi:tetratricopeptide (TPR) repeat protein